MAYLFQTILLVLATATMLSPISFKLSLNDGINLTALIPFLDIRILPTKKKKEKRKRKIGKRFKALLKTAKALRRSFDIFLRRSRLTIFEEKNNETLQNNSSYKGRAILFSLFLSYLATKSGIVTTDNTNNQNNNEVNFFTSALIETRVYILLYSTLTFVIIRYFPKKEHGIVR